jgi:hypothetical protein
LLAPFIYELAEFGETIENKAADYLEFKFFNSSQAYKLHFHVSAVPDETS